VFSESMLDFTVVV